MDLKLSIFGIRKHIEVRPKKLVQVTAFLMDIAY